MRRAVIVECMGQKRNANKFLTGLPGEKSPLRYRLRSNNNIKMNHES
jgi:hypothetical protein